MFTITAFHKKGTCRACLWTNKNTSIINDSDSHGKIWTNNSLNTEKFPQV